MLFESCEIGDYWLAASFEGSLATFVPRTFEEKKEREAFPSFSPELGTRDAPIPSMSEPTEWDIRPSLGSRRSALFPLIDLPQPPGGGKSDTLHFPEKDDEVKNLRDNRRGLRRLLLDTFSEEERVFCRPPKGEFEEEEDTLFCCLGDEKSTRFLGKLKRAAHFLAGKKPRCVV